MLSQYQTGSVLGGCRPRRSDPNSLDTLPILPSRPFAAVVGFSTGSSPGSRAPRRLPPLLLLSGGTTDAIPLAATRALYDAVRASGDPVELYVFPHGAHDWPGRQGRAGIRRAVAFLRAEM